MYIEYYLPTDSPVLAPLAVGGVNVSPCKKGVYATFGTQQRSQAPLGM